MNKNIGLQNDQFQAIKWHFYTLAISFSAGQTQVRYTNSTLKIFFIAGPWGPLAVCHLWTIPYTKKMLLFHLKREKIVWSLIRQIPFLFWSDQIGPFNRSKFFNRQMFFVYIFQLNFIIAFLMTLNAQCCPEDNPIIT